MESVETNAVILKLTKYSMGSQ